MRVVVKIAVKIAVCMHRILARHLNRALQAHRLSEQTNQEVQLCQTTSQTPETVETYTG